MELQGQDKGYKIDSSSKVSTPINSSTVGEMIRDQGTVHGDTIFNLPQTLDQNHPLYHPQLNPQSQPQTQPRPRQNLTNNKPRGSNPDVVPDPATRSKEANRSNRSPAPAPAPATSTAIITVPTIRYRECQKNHAASMGSHVVDGCGEFMPSGEDGTPEALKCAACDCHRNFHRKEIDGEYSQSHFAPNSHYTHNHQPSRNNTNTITQQQQPSFHPINTSPQMASITPMMMNFGGGVTGGSSGAGLDESSSEDLNIFQSGGQPSMQPKKKKRFRTKFSQEQKDKMMEFAEKLGWRIQKQDDQEVQDFCTQVGVKRQVFKIWMHNNKQASKKKHDDDHE